MQYTLSLPSLPLDGERLNVRHKSGANFKTQLLKWVGNKQRMAPGIIDMFPDRFGHYFEPFLGSGGVLGVLAPQVATASDTFAPLVGIWKTLKEEPDTLKGWYAERWERMHSAVDRVEGYEAIKADYNANSNSADLVFLCRACYGGVVRFRQRDGYMSTPCGVHNPISPASFAERVDAWAPRVRGTTFLHADYKATMAQAEPGDLIYCDPPYTFTQAILYGAQTFSLDDLLEAIATCKARGVLVALSIDGTKKSGDMICDVRIPAGLFEKEKSVSVGRSMLRRLQMGGRTLEKEVVTDRLLLTY